jgi:hypothetical protein
MLWTIFPATPAACGQASFARSNAMTNAILAFIIALSLGAFAASASAMTENDYRSERARLKEQYSFRFVECNPFTGREKRDCASKLRTERDNALDKLEADYKRNKQG